MKRVVLIVLVCVMLFSVAGCASGSGESVDLMADIGQVDVIVCWAEEPDKGGYLDFSVRLMQECYQGGNALVSPLSVYTALSMTANGAAGETLEQMELVLGMSLEDRNGWIHAILTEEREELRLANAIWFTDAERFTVNRDFLVTNAEYYNAGIYSAPFDDSTLKEINNWVKENTDGMIPGILDQIRPDAVMYLVNALAFEAKWQTVYTGDQVRDRNFTLEDGTVRKVEFMYSEESRYLENDITTGFLKPYRGGSYAFVALLPREGMTMAEFVDALDGEMLARLLDSVENTMVDTALPGFEVAYGVELADILQGMGMELPFDQKCADFSGLGTSVAGNIAINRVIHKTYISVTSDGTRAAAATIVEPTDAAAPMEIERKSVILDRPFLYMIVDTETGIPIFIGTMMDPGQ